LTKCVYNIKLVYNFKENKMTKRHLYEFESPSDMKARLEYTENGLTTDEDDVAIDRNPKLNKKKQLRKPITGIRR
jgi:hypothetical protein